MSNKLLMTALAAMISVTTAAQVPAASKKKKPVQSDEQTEESAEKDAMDDAMLDIATGMLGGAMKKAKLPKGGKLIMKQGVKAVKDAAKKSKKDDGEKDAGKKKKNPLNMLMGGDDEE